MNEEEKKQPWQRFRFSAAEEFLFFSIAKCHSIVLRYWLMSKLLPGGGLLGVAKLVGTHYEVISIIYRLLGAKVTRPFFVCHLFFLLILRLFLV